MTKLQTQIQQSYDALLGYAEKAHITLLHPQSRYRSLVVAKLLHEQPRPVLYYAMGAYDNTMAAFLAGLVHDLAEQAPNFGWRTLHALQTQAQARHVEAFLAPLLADLAELSPEPYFLILDDYDSSANIEGAQGFMEAVLSQLPPQCQVIINSRSLPRLPWLALVARNKAIILNDDLLMLDNPYRHEQEASLGTLQVRCLGQNVIQRDHELIEEWEGHLPRLLFIFALERPVVTRTEICQAFWPDLDLDQAVNVFHVTKRRLHKALSIDVLVHQEGYYQVNPQIHLEYDTSTFVAALLQGRTGPAEEAAAAWERALELYQGDFLPGQQEAWIKTQRQAYQQGYVEAVLAVAAHRVKAGRPEQALRLLSQACQSQEQYEVLHWELMTLYSQLGRRSEAAAHFQAWQQLLKQQGLSLSPQSQAFYQALMS
jgi:DNA-binding SARP family transcriptional activator